MDKATMVFPSFLQQQVDMMTSYKENDRMLSTIPIALCFFAIEFLFKNGPLSRFVRSFFQKRNKSINKKQLDEVVSGTAVRIACNTHNFVACYLAFKVLFSWITRDIFFAASPDSKFLLAYSSGFFLYDLLVSIRDVRTEGIAFVVHGFLCWAVYSLGLYSNFLHFFGAGFILWELSTPLVHVRWVLFNLGMAEHPLYFLNGIFMTVAFFSCRIIFGYWLSSKVVGGFWAMYKQDELPFPRPVVLAIVIACILLNTLNTVWFLTMLGKLISYSKKLARYVMVSAAGPKKNSKETGAGGKKGPKSADGKKSK